MATSAPVNQWGKAGPLINAQPPVPVWQNDPAHAITCPLCGQAMQVGGGVSYLTMGPGWMVPAGMGPSTMVLLPNSPDGRTVVHEGCWSLCLQGQNPALVGGN